MIRYGCHKKQTRHECEHFKKTIKKRKKREMELNTKQHEKQNIDGGRCKAQNMENTLMQNKHRKSKRIHGTGVYTVNSANRVNDNI